jgi:hypothetical protein
MLSQNFSSSQHHRCTDTRMIVFQTRKCYFAWINALWLILNPYGTLLNWYCFESNKNAVYFRHSLFSGTCQSADVCSKLEKYLAPWNCCNSLMGCVCSKCATVTQLIFLVSTQMHGALFPQATIVSGLK